MKLKILFIVSLIITSSAISQETCSQYYPFEEGTKFQITNYNKKGKVETITDYHVSEVIGKTATFNIKISDKKGKEVTTTSYNIICDGNIVSIDFKSLINPDMMKHYKDLEVDFTGTNIELPNNLSTGKNLKDANMNMALKMGGINMNMSVDLIDRKVINKEKITTSAGTFNCFVITYTMQMKMGLKSTFKNKEWIAEGVGLVKSENYNKKGKLMSYSELTKISK